MNHNQAIGKWGEKAAEEYLIAKGFTIMEHNIRTPYGEIDIIASIEDVIVFVEVKTRTSRTFGLPEEALTSRKLDHMLASAEYFAANHAIGSWQCDAIAVERTRDAGIHIEHFENVTR